MLSTTGELMCDIVVGFEPFEDELLSPEISMWQPAQARYEHTET